MTIVERQLAHPSTTYEFLQIYDLSLGKMKPYYLSLLALLLGMINVAQAFDTPVPASNLPANFEFDGMVSPGEWDAIEPIQLTVQSPVYHQEPTERTEIKMAYDDKYVYLSGAMYDSEPDKIMDNNLARDGGEASTEWFGMVIDSYNDKQNGLGFFTTPTGSRFDAAIGNDAQGREPMNVSWNNFWDAKAVMNEDGWFAEIRVPWSSLQYEIKDGKVTMGITVWRYLARKNELHVSPDIPPDLGEMGIWRPSQSKEYVFENVERRKPFYVTPYILGGASDANSLNESETAYVNEKKTIKDIGLDVKLGVLKNFTLDLSINTDFAQVEADDQQINLTRFSLFFPEKRLFFQERSGIFSFRFGGRNDLFYSRRIGIDDDGNSIPIIGGARLTGRSGKWDVGLISMQTQQSGEFLSNNYSVFRLKKQIINENSDIGFLSTYNVDADGTYNAVYGFDTNIRVWGNDFLSVKFGQNLENDLNYTPLDSDQTMFWISLVKRSQKGFGYAVSLSRLGEDFDSNVGFIERENYTRFGNRLEYNFWPSENSKLFRHGPTMGGRSFWDNTDNKYNSSSHRAGWDFIWKNGSALELRSIFQYDNILETFSLADVVDIPVGSYFYSGCSVQYSTAIGRPYSVRSEVSVGDFFDGQRNSFQVSPLWAVSSRLSLSGTYEYNDIRFDLRDEGFDTHIARIRAQVSFSTKFSISSFIQYNSLSKSYNGNVRVRYNPREGNDLFIVYNTDVNADRFLENPTLPEFNQQSLLVKYSYTFVL